MKRTKAILPVIIFLLILGASFTPIYPDSLRISQIDSTSLIINQKVKVYVSVTDVEGASIKNLGKDNFQIFETAEDRPELEREVLLVEKGVNINRGINLLLILDNSGSMYWDGSGKIKNSDNEEIWRITFAKNAINSFLKEIKNPRDKIGLFVFNVKIGAKTELTNDRVQIVKALSEAARPPEEEAYTEALPKPGDGTQRSVESVVATVKSHTPALQDCWKQEIKINPLVKGRIVIRFVANPFGEVIDVTVVSSTINSQVLINCVVKKIQRWRDFDYCDPNIGNIPYKIPFKFGL